MANSANQAGLEARQRHGIIRSHRWLLLRRLSQLAVLMMFIRAVVGNLDFKRKLQRQFTA